MAVQPPGIERRGDVARPVDRAGKIRGDLVSADDEKHALRPVDRTGHAVAEAVDVDDLAILAHAVGAAEIGLRLPCPLSRFRRMVLPVPKYFVALAETVIDAERIDRHAAADADAGAVQRLHEIVRRFRAGGKAVNAKAPAFQILSRLFQIRHGVQSSSMLSNPWP